MSPQVQRWCRGLLLFYRLTTNQYEQYFWVFCFEIGMFFKVDRMTSHQRTCKSCLQTAIYSVFRVNYFTPVENKLKQKELKRHWSHRATERRVKHIRISSALLCHVWHSHQWSNKYLPLTHQFTNSEAQKQRRSCIIARWWTHVWTTGTTRVRHHPSPLPPKFHRQSLRNQKIANQLIKK